MLWIWQGVLQSIAFRSSGSSKGELVVVGDTVGVGRVVAGRKDRGWVTGSKPLRLPEVKLDPIHAQKSTIEGARKTTMAITDKTDLKTAL